MKKPGWLLSLTQHGSKAPYLLKQRSSEGFVIGTVALAVFTKDMFLYGMIVPVIPFALQERSHVSHGKVQYWVSVLVAIYGAALLAFSPVLGWLADRSSSRRSPLLLGLLALLGATVLLNVGNKTGVLVIGRVLQGISAAVVWVVGLALIADTVPQERLGQAMGYVGLGMSVGILVAPLLGGIVFEHAGYNAVFAMAYALIGVDIVLRLLLVEKKVAARWDPDDVDGAADTSGQTEDTQTVGRDAGSSPHLDQKEVLETNSRPSDPEKGAMDATAAANDSTEPLAEPARQRRRDKLPPVLSLLYSRRLLAALFASLIQAALLTSFDSVLTIRAANIFGWRSTGAALLFLPLVIPSFLAPLFGLIADRVGGRYPASLGFLLGCPPFVCLRFIDENTIKDKVTACALLALIGLFLSLTFPPIMAEISGIVEAKEKQMLATGRQGYGKAGATAQAYALFNMAFAGGCMVGPLLAGFIAQEHGWSIMSWVLGLLCGFTAIPTFFYLGGFILKKQ
ncbi:MFS transporter-like protein [Lophiotrema nucula]|uniref:MFS transporter-like protein n=1 Tax=Lophiotrema nucula TaxID=690887 RepID=A0A6A5Z9S1_9PLEO|nr:MFS transporter-like protein [Lophiotrema nucula]